MADGSHSGPSSLQSTQTHVAPPQEVCQRCHKPQQLYLTTQHNSPGQTQSGYWTYGCQPKATLYMWRSLLQRCVNSLGQEIRNRDTTREIIYRPKWANISKPDRTSIICGPLLILQMIHFWLCWHGSSSSWVNMEKCAVQLGSGTGRSLQTTKGTSYYRTCLGRALGWRNLLP